MFGPVSMPMNPLFSSVAVTDNFEFITSDNKINLNIIGNISTGEIDLVPSFSGLLGIGTSSNALENVWSNYYNGVQYPIPSDINFKDDVFDLDEGFFEAVAAFEAGVGAGFVAADSAPGVPLRQKRLRNIVSSRSDAGAKFANGFGLC